MIAVPSCNSLLILNKPIFAGETSGILFVSGQPYISIYNGIYSVLKKKEILPFATTWIILENLVSSGVNQKKKDNTALSHLYEEPKKVKLLKSEN